MFVFFLFGCSKVMFQMTVTFEWYILSCHLETEELLFATTVWFFYSSIS